VRTTCVIFRKVVLCMWGMQRMCEGESNENLTSLIKIQNTARLSCKLTAVILMVPCVYNQMLRWFPTFQVATTCFSCSPPDLNLLLTNFTFCIQYNKHCHRVTTQLQLINIIIIIIRVADRCQWRLHKKK